MDHPSSPLTGAQVPDSHSPHSPPPDLRHRMGDRYRPPPPGYPVPPLGYPHYPPYGGPPQSPYGPPPPSHTYTSRAPPGYPGPPQHHSPPFGYGYPPGTRVPPYHYTTAYDGAYAAAPTHQAPPYRSAAPPRPGPPVSQSGPVSQESSPQKIGGTTSPKASPNRSPRDASASSRPSKQQDGGIDVERLRAAAAAELTHEEVKPIQSDFHFFAKENAPKYRALAEEEVRKSLRPDEKLDPLVINTNLNSRLKLAWENLTNDERDAYMIKEEEDRRRFMEEDEIASRHCATLTARGKSPRTPDKVEKSVKSEERQESETFPHTTPNRESSPSPKSVATDQEDELDENKDNTKETLSSESNSDPDESCVSLTSDSPKKRSSSPKLNGDSQLESPTKRNRQLHETKI